MHDTKRVSNEKLTMRTKRYCTTNWQRPSAATCDGGKVSIVSASSNAVKLSNICCSGVRVRSEYAWWIGIRVDQMKSEYSTPCLVKYSSTEYEIFIIRVVTLTD